MANLGEWINSVSDAKRIAKENRRPLIVVACNSVTCKYCKDAEAKVFQNQIWKDYAKSHGIPQYLADQSSKESLFVRNALNKEYKTPIFPSVLIFELLESCDVNTKDLNQKPIKEVVASRFRAMLGIGSTPRPAANPNVGLIGKFVFRKGSRANSRVIAEITPEEFIKTIEGFYGFRNNSWLKPL